MADYPARTCLLQVRHREWELKPSLVIPNADFATDHIAIISFHRPHFSFIGPIFLSSTAELWTALAHRATGL